MRLTTHTAVTCSLLLTLLAADARAQAPSGTPPGGLADKSLEDLMSVEVGTVFGAAKREQRVTEAPSSVTILTAADIRTFGWHTLAEALTSVRGFYTTNDRNYTYVGVRGFGRPSDYNNRILVLVNGHRYNDNVYDQALVGNEFGVEMSLGDRVEIIRGPGSALYGTSAFFAVINVVTRPGGAVGGTESSIEAASYDTYRLRASYGGRTASGFDALLSVSRLSSDGRDVLYFPEYDDPSTNNGLSLGADGESATSLFASLRRGGFSLQGAFSSRRKGMPTGSFETVFDTRNHTVDSRGWIDASLSGTLRGAAVTGRVFGDYSGYHGDYVYADQVLDHDAATGVWFGAEGVASKRFGERHQVTSGVEYRRNARQDQSSYYVEPFSSLLDARYRSNQAAVYVQDEILLHRRFTATAGARYDWWSLIGGTATPRVGLVYRTDADTAFKVLYGEAYRAPTVYETYYYPGPVDRVLRPERLRTSEVVYEQYIGGSLRLTATGYFTNARNLITQGAADYFENREQAQSRGVELEAERRWTTGVLLRGSYVVQRTRDPQEGHGEELSNSPRQLGLIHAAAPLWARRVTVAAESQYVGSRLSPLNTHMPGVWLTNLNVSYAPPGRALSLAARVSNAFDRAYGHPVGFEFRQDQMPQDGRTFSLRASLRF